MERFFGKIALLILFGLILIVNDSYALSGGQINYQDRPIIILAIDKVESVELFGCQYSAIGGFLEESACGLMSVRTGSGYNNSESGFLTLGTGNRSFAPPLKVGALKSEEPIMSEKSGPFWRWSTGFQLDNKNLFVPEIGWLLNQAEKEDLSLQPGLLGEIFKSNGWETFLLGDQDTFTEPSRPGGYTLMDQNGILDSGLVGLKINESDHNFPYRYHFNSERVLNEMKKQFKPGSLILVEFGDFARLDRFRDELLTEQYLQLKKEIWERLDHFLKGISQNWSNDQYRMVILSPSLSREGSSKRSMLAPILIRGAGYQKGLLTSGTTSWEGLVANIDLLPTLVNMAGLEPSGAISGRTMRSRTSPNHLAKLTELNNKINKINASQRSLLDWYLWIISTGWLAVTLSIFLKKKVAGGFLLIVVAVVPLAMLIMPLTPMFLWQEVGLFLLTLILSLPLMKLKTTNQRFLLLSAGLWGGLILDQVTGWNLIRFSALGYSAVAGSRYYGIGNEYMGVLLAVSLVLAHLLSQTLKSKWPAIIILLLSVVTLGWPQLGINFGGTLAALAGYFYYLVKLYGLDWKNKKVWIILGGFILTIALISWWDSRRDPELQTHLGRFFQIIIDLNFSQTWQIFSRKAAMNFKLIIYSAWTKTILLMAAITILNRIISYRLVALSERSVWNGILVSGLAAFLVNDSGVVAFGTCLAFGFTYLLSRFEEREFSSNAVQHSCNKAK